MPRTVLSEAAAGSSLTIPERDNEVAVPPRPEGQLDAVGRRPRQAKAREARVTG